MLSMQELEAQSAVELPNRDLMALVTIIVRDVVDDVDIRVPIAVAANICGVSVLSLQGATECDATSFNRN